MDNKTKESLEILHERLDQLEKTVDHTARALEQHTKVGYNTSSNFTENFRSLFTWQKEVDESIHRLEQDYHRNVRDWSQTVSERASKDKSFVDCLRDELKYEIIRDFLKETIEMSTKDINMLESNKQLKAFQKEDLRMNYRVRNASQELLEYVGEDDE